MASENVQVSTKEGHRVHVGNLTFNTTEEELREHLASAGGSIVEVILPLRFGRKPGGFAFVVYEKEEDAKAVAEKLNGSELNGRPLKIDPARSKEESDAARAASREKREAARAARQAEKGATGETTAVTDGEVSEEQGERKKKPSKKRAPRRRQPGEEGEEGTAAEAAEGVEGTAETGDAEAKPKRKPRKPKAAREPKEARIDAAEGDAETTPEKPKNTRAPGVRKPREKRMEPTGEQSKTLIFVANLPFNVDDDALSALFTNLSINVKSAKVATRLTRPKNKDEPRVRRSRGYGFVEVEDPAQQQEAVEKVEGSLIGDRKISAKIANEMKPIEKAEAKEAAQDGAEIPDAVAA